MCKFFKSVFNAAAGLGMVHQSSFGLDVVFSVTELFTEFIYERERYFDTRPSGEKSEFLCTDSASVLWSVLHAEFVKCTHLLPHYQFSFGSK